MVGWSRGGVIIATVARDLDTVFPTPDGGIRIAVGGQTSIPVHWLGMFDAANRMGGFFNRRFISGEIKVKAPNNDWAWTLTTNVMASSHLVKSTLLPFNNLLFHTVLTLGTIEFLPNPFPILSLSAALRRAMLSHGYIGTSQEALDWMIQRALKANVPFNK